MATLVGDRPSRTAYGRDDGDLIEAARSDPFGRMWMVGQLLVLDDDAQLDCLAPTGSGRLGHVLAASDGGLYAAGTFSYPDGAHFALVRVR